MFEDSLLEGKMKTKRGMTTMISFIIQVVIVGVLILIPLIYTEALPTQQLTTFLVAPPPPPPPPPPPAAAQVVRVRRVESELNNGVLRQPTAIPKKVAQIREDDSPPPTGGVVGGVGGVFGGVPGGQMGGVIGGIISNTPAPVVKMATPQKIRVSSGVSEGLLLRKVQPVYPPLAKAAHVSGAVQLQATIGRDGSIQNLRVVSGHPMLTQAALDAVRQWRYRPYLLNGEAVEVDTTVTVNFNLSGG